MVIGLRNPKYFLQKTMTSSKGWLIISFLLSTFSLQGQHSPETDEVFNLIPERLKGYQPVGEFKGRKMTMGTISYSVCEKKFEASNKSVKILLFDYKDAHIMYEQAMHTWGSAKPIESDSIIFRTLTLSNCTGWESYSKRSGTSQIFLGIGERFFLHLNGTHVDLDQLKAVMQDIDPEKFLKK